MALNEPITPQLPRPKHSLPVRILRFPLKIVLLAIVGVLMGLRRHPRVAMLSLAVLIVAGGAAYYFTPAPAPSAATAASVGGAGAALTSVQGSLPSPQTPYTYFKAQQAGDANTMWGLLSDSLKQSGSEQQLQSQLDQVRPQLGAIKQITYVGGAKEEDGNAVYLYLLTLDQGGQTNQVTYLFTLDTQGKIVKVE